MAAASEAIAPWPQDGPRVRWRVPLGPGYSGVSISKGAVYVMFAQGDSEFIARVDDLDGRQLWKSRIGNNFDAEFTSGPRASPTVEADSVYVLGSFGNLLALDVRTGAERWAIKLDERLKVLPPRFGYSSSPLLVDELLLVQVGGEGRRYLAAVDKRTGMLGWSLCVDDGGYSSPISLTLNGEQQVIVVTLREILAVSLAGQVLWALPWPGVNNIATPLFIPPNRLFVSHNEDDGGILLELSAPGEAAVREVWRTRFLKNHYSSSVLFAGHLYGFDNATLRCVDAATGESRWAQRGFGKGSLIRVADRLLVLGDLGDLALVEASPSGYRELSRSRIFNDRSWTAPSLVGKRLYVRSQTELVSFDLSGEGFESQPDSI